MSVKQHVRGVQHLGIPTNDIETTKKFFISLGFEEVYHANNNGELVSFLRLGNCTIETYQNNQAHMAPGAIDHIALDVDDIEATYEQVKKLGYKELENGIQQLPFWEKGCRYFTIMGPNKEKVEFSQIL
ncbi:hypothetical protein M9Y10_000039 [Tritrichomonas musculus]|uniref:VOC domain-containing protein n=1 Tax=Tritrichomonas musculus TaxID=1915356 RepID=A0ABR2L499_9EUKA